MSNPPLCGLEFYSGIGGFHHGSTLFNHLIHHHRDYLPPQDCPTSWYKNQLLNSPMIFRPQPDRVYNANFPKPRNLAQTKTDLPQIQIIESFDINPVANDVYFHNFHRKPNSQDICTLTKESLMVYKSDIWFISNPCQPFSIQNDVNLDEKDPRTNSFLNLLSILAEMPNKPQFLVLENVENFESSHTYQILLQTLHNTGYYYNSFILSPRQFAIPNQRSRFFLLASLHHSPLLPFTQLFNKAGIDISQLNATPFSQSQSITHTNQPQAHRTPTPPPPQSVFKFLPTVHFLPNFCTEEFFAKNRTHQQLHQQLWSNADDAFDVLRSTATPPVMMHNASASDQTRVNQLPSPLPDTTDHPTNQLKPISATNRRLDKQEARDHERTTFSAQFLPIVAPSTLDNFLVDHSDLSEESYLQYLRVLKESQNTSNTEQMNRNRLHLNENDHNPQQIVAKDQMHDNQPSNGDRNCRFLQTDTEHTFLTLPDSLLQSITSTDDIDTLPLSKKEKNKLKRVFTKKLKKWENAQKSTSNTTQPTPVPRTFLLKHRQEQLQTDRQRQEMVLLETAHNAQSLSIDPKLFLKGSVYTIDIVSHMDRSTCCFTKGYSSYFRGTGSILETYRPKSRRVVSQIIKQATSNGPNCRGSNTSHNDGEYYMGASGESNDQQQKQQEHHSACDFDVFSSTPLESTFFSTISTQHPSFLPYLSPSLSPRHDNDSITRNSSPHQADPHNLPTTTPTTTTTTTPATTPATTPTVTTPSNDDDLLYLSPSAPMGLRGLRYFLPREVANLNMLPPPPSNSKDDQDLSHQSSQSSHFYAHFDFPHHITAKQALKLLGNGLNSYIIAQLLLVLLGGHYRYQQQQQRRQ